MLYNCTLHQIPCVYLSIYFTKEDKSDVKRDMAKQIPIAFGIGVSLCVVQAISRFCLNYVSAGMTKTIRNQVYHSMLSKTISYFDDKSNSVGKLIEVLASQTRDLNGVSAEFYVLVYQGVIVIIICWVVSMIFWWNLGLIVIGLVPSMAASNYALSQFVISKKGSNNL